MIYAQFNHGRDFLASAEHDTDLLQFVTQLADKNGIKVAVFTAIGALKCAKLGFYDQEKHEYQEITLDSPHEIASCVGNISLKEGKIFAHAHAVLADKNGNTKAGHFFEGTVFAAEVHLHELEGTKLERKHDNATGLHLLEITSHQHTSRGKNL